MIKAIVFDYVGVIAPSGISSLLKAKYGENSPIITELNQYSNKWDLGEINYEEYNQLLSKITKTPVELIWDTFFKNIKPFPEVIDLIKKLKKNYKIFLLSNNFSPNLKKIMKNQNIENLFDEIIISSDYHLKKPQQEFFNLMLSIGKISASEAIFIDDRLENTDAANNLGIKSFQFIDAATLQKDLTSIDIKY